MWVPASLTFGLATLGYAGSIVFYNSFLPVIAAPENQDRISARGYSMGYLGSVILLVFNILMIFKPGLSEFRKVPRCPTGYRLFQFFSGG